MQLKNIKDKSSRTFLLTPPFCTGAELRGEDRPAWAGRKDFDIFMHLDLCSFELVCPKSLFRDKKKLNFELFLAAGEFRAKGRDCFSQSHRGWHDRVISLYYHYHWSLITDQFIISLSHKTWNQYKTSGNFCNQWGNPPMGLNMGLLTCAMLRSVSRSILQKKCYWSIKILEINWIIKALTAFEKYLEQESVFPCKEKNTKSQLTASRIPTLLHFEFFQFLINGRKKAKAG